MKKIFYLLLTFIFIFIISCAKEVTYNVTMHIDGETELVKVSENSVIDFENPNPDLYIFLGWFNEDFTIELTNEVITSDIDIYAKIILKGTEYKITYNLEGGEFNSANNKKYQVGTKYTLPTPIKEPFYEFSGWLLNGEIINEVSDTMYGDIVLTATWTDIAKYYNVSYNIGEGTIQSELKEIFREGDDAYTLPDAIPNDENLYFWGWYLDENHENRIKVIDETLDKDLTLYAYYGKRNAENTYISFLGDSITTFSGYIPSGFACYYPQGDVKTVEDTWWYKLTDKLGYNLLMNNSYSGSKVVAGQMEGQSEERLAYLATNDKTPDVVVIYMGTNDWASPTDASKFMQGYKKMLDYIYNNYGDDTSVYACMMPTNDYSAGFQTYREGLNRVLTKIALDYPIVLIDFREAITEENLEACTYSGCHPNAYGMTQMAEYAYNIIYEKETEKMNSK